MIQRLRKTVREQIAQGFTPHGLALSVSFAVVFGSFPLLGFTTLLCLGAGFLFKLNHPLLQAANYLMAPVQLLLIPVFLRLGEKLVGAPPISFSPKQVLADFTSGYQTFFEKWGMSGALAVMAWAVISPFVFLLIYKITRGIFERTQREMERRRTPKDQGAI